VLHSLVQVQEQEQLQEIQPQIHNSTWLQIQTHNQLEIHHTVQQEP